MQLVASKPEACLGIDLSDPVRMALVQGNPARVVAVREAKNSFDPGSSESLANLAREVREFVREVRGCCNCVLGLPVRDAMLAVVDLPPLEKKHCRDALRLELLRLFPAKVAELRATYQEWPQSIPRPPSSSAFRGGKAYILAAAPAASVLAARKLAASCGLKPEAVEVPALAACRSSWWCYRLRMQDPSDSPGFTMEISLSVAKDAVMHLGFGPFPWLTREIPLQSGESYQDAQVLAGEVARSVRFANGILKNPLPARVTLYGVPERVDLIANILREQLPIEVQVWGVPPISCQPQYGIAAGLALRKEPFV
ncbi:MAG TPA: hypothetical protein GXX40_09555 [Firmicutes bacterium]|nr:hypothetical protein [Bacillota bacterium]